MSWSSYRNPGILLLLMLMGSAQSLWSQGNEEIQDHSAKAKAALLRNDLRGAAEEYQAILRSDPTNAGVYTALGVAQYGMGDLSDAVNTFQKTLQLDSSQKRAELFLGLSESDLGYCSEGVPILDKYLPAEPDVKLRRLAGLALLNCQLAAPDSASALETVRKLRESFPDDADVLYKSAELYTKLWNQSAGELMQKHPESYRVHQLAGEIFQAQEKYDSAIKEFRLAINENPRLPELHLRIGQLILKQNTENADQDALSEFQKELETNPSSATAEYAIGEVYRNRQEFQEATQHFTNAIRLDSGFAEPHLGMGQIFFSQRDYAKARNQFETATRLQPENATAHYHLMLVYRSLGDSEAANREMALFQKLQEQNDAGFQVKLHSLLTGTVESASHGK